MSAVILCEFSADASVKALILDSIILLAIEGSGELLFAGRHRSDADSDRELVAARLNSLERAVAVIRTWRMKQDFPSTVDLRLVQLESMRTVDNPLMLFP